MRNVLYLALAGAVVAALAIAPRAEPAFPGANGEIVFSIVLPTSYEGAWLGDAQHFDFVLCTIRPDGEARQRITGIDGNSLEGPAWSADGSRLAFMGGAFPQSPFVERVDGTGSLILLPEGSSPAWSPAATEFSTAPTQTRCGEPRRRTAADPRGAWRSARLVAGRHAHRLHRQRPARNHRSGRVGNVVLTSGPATHASPTGRRTVDESCSSHGAAANRWRRSIA